MTELELLSLYKKYDFLNKKSHNPLIKILVSYIKPSFLYKTDVLTPIHLGRAVEQENSKDGYISQNDLDWLHQNCLSDADVPNSLSAYNRRLGFFTGTYWAWKNYDKLGNSDYFGSFGYRKLLHPSCLMDLQMYDIILPDKAKFSGTLKEQLINSHGIKYYDCLINTISDIYPNELENMKSYLNQHEGYFHEIYIMKKQIFFDFCLWLEKIIRYWIEQQTAFIPHQEKCLSEKHRPLLGNDFDFINHLFHVEPGEKRDLAFIIERLTGYYCYQISQNFKCKNVPLQTFGYFLKTKELAYKKTMLKILHNKAIQHLADETGEHPNE